MNLASIFKCIVWIFAAALVTQNVSASPTSTTVKFKSFAVFTASYNTGNDVVRGGVCGTVFFVSGTRAVTAFHVLKAESFKPLPGFERVRVWLVHEGQPAIELKAEYLQSNPFKDVTLIQLPKAQAVGKQFVFDVARIKSVKEKVETEGFVANTDGPVMIREGKDITVQSVPHLQRLQMSGTIVRLVQVNMKASDIDLRSSSSVELSYQPIVGISGGPVTSGGRVVAMNSFADPQTRKSTWALELKATNNALFLP